MERYSILLVDDEMVIRETLGADLKNMGYKVQVVESGEEAISLLKENNGYGQFDLVITNLMLPGIDGTVVLKEVKKVSSGILVILLTGYGDLETVIDSIRLHADDYIMKPCKSKDLQFRIKRCFERYELKKKLKFYEDMLKVCCVCNKIKESKTDKPEDKEEWINWNDYISNKGNITITHSYCPECFEKAEKPACLGT
ncbi:MAG: response regulator [Candidatus Anammoxibacter sp.]